MSGKIWFVIPNAPGFSNSKNDISDNAFDLHLYFIVVGEMSTRVGYPSTSH
jgi:hypothetical protein